MPDRRIFNRRQLLQAASSSLLPLFSQNLLGCASEDESPAESDEPRPQNLPESDAFTSGVAAGDPTQNQLIIWTRINSSADGDIMLEWEVSSDEDFDKRVASGSGKTSKKVDYTAKVDVNDLEPGTTYYYRFIYDGEASPTGRANTLPEGDIDEVKLAVVSCSNYPAGYFHVYAEVAKADVDAVLHLGDYIYEYGSGGYATELAEELDREPKPSEEVLSLRDYRTRYAQYRSDPDLQTCHAQHAFIAVWDDHEVANDAYESGAENHDKDEGSFDERKAAALQAYFEWMPIRPPSSADDIVYRQFTFGNLVDLLMLDTRLVGRDRQLSLNDYVESDDIDLEVARAAIGDSDRTLLGSKQKKWLIERLEKSSTRWQVLGQQVLMSRYELPAQLLLALDPNDINAEAVMAGAGTALAAAAAKNKAPEDRTTEEQALLDNTLPYNLDAWDGYAAERDEILEAAHQAESRLVVLAGDTHNAWASALTTPRGEAVGLELGTASVSSPGFDQVLAGPNAELFEGLVVTLIDDLEYVNFTQRGFVLVEFTRKKVSGHFNFVSTVQKESYELADEKTVSLSDRLAVRVS